MIFVRRVLLAGLALALPALAAAQSYTISPPAYQLVTDNSGRTVNGGCVWTYTAGTTTAATTYSDNAGTPNTNPIKADAGGRFVAYLATGASYKFAYENTPCTISPPVHGSTLKTVDNISAMPISSAGVDVVGTAGESITAGQCVYLSDGSSSKTAGQWYKCDSAATYSSTGNWVGIATINIASAASGTIRIAGSVTGLSALTLGTTYYAGTAGALTSTAPTIARRLGEADTATTLVLTANPAGVPAGGTIGQVWTSGGTSTPALFQAQGFFNDFRLSLTTATCVTTSDVTAATTLYYTPCTGNRITLFDTSGNVETCTTAEISIAVPATTSQMYDVWAYDSTFGTCTVTLELLAWTNDTTRATAIAKTSGSNWRYTKSGNTSRMYVGSFRTTTVSGQTEDSAAKRYVWNYYNRARRPLRKQEATASWAYTTTTIRCANTAGACVNQVDVVVGVAEVRIDLRLMALALNSAGTSNVAVGIGEDSTTAFAAEMLGGATSTAVANTYAVIPAALDKMPAVGRHYYPWLEYGAANNTFYGKDQVTTGTQTGLTGGIEG